MIGAIRFKKLLIKKWQVYFPPIHYCSDSQWTLAACHKVCRFIFSSIVNVLYARRFYGLIIIIDFYPFINIVGFSRL